MKLSAGDMTEVTGVTAKQLRSLCENGVLVPDRSGTGHGNFRHFTVMQAVALAYAARWAAMGYSRELVEKILDFLGDMPEAKLQAAFRKGRTHLIPRPDAPMELIRWPAEHGEVFDLKAVYADVQKAIEKMVEEGKAVRVDGRGRKRGLAAEKEMSQR